MKINFVPYKTTVIKELVSKNVIDQRIAVEFGKSKTLCSLRDKFEVFLENETNIKPAQEYKKLGIDSFEKQGKTTLAAEQFMYKIADKINHTYLGFAKITSKTDQKEKVLKIKQKLKDDYGTDAQLNDSIKFANACLKAMKILKKNNMKLPKQIIGSDMIPNCYAGYEKGVPTIVINTKMSQFGFEPENLLPYVLHESSHLNQPQLFAFNFKKIPKKLRETADNISMYAYKNFSHEVDAELKTKKLLEGLSPEEKQLEKFLNS